MKITRRSLLELLLASPLTFLNRKADEETIDDETMNAALSDFREGRTQSVQEILDELRSNNEPVIIDGILLDDGFHYIKVQRDPDCISGFRAWVDPEPHMSMEEVNLRPGNGEIG